LSYIHYLLKGKKSPYSSLKDENKLLVAYEKLKKYETLQPKTPLDSLCKEINKCKGKPDTEKLRKFLAYSNNKDLIKCFEKNFFIDFIEGGSDGCCTYEERSEFQPSWIQNWSLETILIIQSMIYVEGFVDDYSLGHFIEVILVDKDILKSSRNGYTKVKN
jgi:hypothetical protein